MERAMKPKFYRIGQCTVAYHEAGHAVVAYRLQAEIRYVTIVPDHWCAGHFTHNDLFCARGLGSDRANLERAIQISLAGPLAQARFHRRSYRRRHGRQDYDCATGLARYLAGSAGEREFLRYQERYTKVLVDHYWSDIERIARALLERDELSGTEVKNIIEEPRRLKREDRADQQRWIEAMADER
jgi:ATP-dependent Zn protease